MPRRVHRIAEDHCTLNTQCVSTKLSSTRSTQSCTIMKVLIITGPLLSPSSYYTRCPAKFLGITIVSIEWERLVDAQLTYMFQPARRHNCIAEPQLRPMQSPASKCSPSYWAADSGRLTFLKETACSQEWLVLRATNAHQTMSRWLLFAKNCESFQTNQL